MLLSYLPVYSIDIFFVAYIYILFNLFFNPDTSGVSLFAFLAYFLRFPCSFPRCFWLVAVLLVFLLTLCFQVQFVSPVRNAPELSNETRVDEEQRWVSRGHSQATLEIRRKLPDLRDGKRECSCSIWFLFAGDQEVAAGFETWQP